MCIAEIGWIVFTWVITPIAGMFVIGMGMSF